MLKYYVVQKTIKITKGYRDILARSAKEAEEIARDMGEVKPDYDTLVDTDWKAKINTCER